MVSRIFLLKVGGVDGKGNRQDIGSVAVPYLGKERLL
jgi:hypothetical protein